MPINRRDLLKLGSLAAAIGIATRAGFASAEVGTVGRAPRPLRILILGGTGFTGPHQVRFALARGHKLTLFNRGTHDLQWPGQVEELTGDRNGNLDVLRGREWDVCIDNPTTLPVWVRDAGRVLRGKVGQYIFISTISVYADNATPDADESAPLAAYAGKDAMAETIDTLRADPGSLYGPLKALSEKEAEKQFPGKATIIRPGLIVGPGDPTDRFTYWPVRLARGGEVLAPGDGSDPVQFIDARDLAEWTIRMAEQRAFGTFNATGPDYPLSTAAMLHGIRATNDAGAKLTWVASDFLEAHEVHPWSDLPVWVPAQGDGAGFARRNIARARAAGLAFRPLADTARDTLDWYEAQPAERKAKLKAGLDPAREQELLAAWHAKPG
jgi:2'-hydroxyisoflavone reductase